MLWTSEQDFLFDWSSHFMNDKEIFKYLTYFAVNVSFNAMFYYRRHHNQNPGCTVFVLHCTTEGTATLICSTV